VFGNEVGDQLPPYSAIVRVESLSRHERRRIIPETSIERLSAPEAVMNRLILLVAAAWLGAAPWTDPSHFLHRTVSSFTVCNKHLGSTLEAVIDALGPFPWPAGERFVSTTRQADRVISVNLGPT
jgi:hypothetical protein